MALAVSALVSGLAWSLVGAFQRSAAAPERLGDRVVLRQLADLLVEDLMQLGTTADDPHPLTASDDAFTFRRVRFEPDAIALEPVTWTYARGPRGRGGRLLRTWRRESPAEPLRVDLTSCRFALVEHPVTGAAYLLVYLTAGSSELSQLIPLPSPPARGNPALAACTTPVALEEPLRSPRK